MIKIINCKSVTALLVAVSIYTAGFVLPNYSNASEKPNSDSSQEIRPFNNMVRKMMLLAEDVLSDTSQTPPTSPAAPATPEDKTTQADATPANTNSTPATKEEKAQAATTPATPAATVSTPQAKLPTASITSGSAGTPLPPPAPAQVTTTPATKSPDTKTAEAAPKIETPEATELELPNLDDPEPEAKKDQFSIAPGERKPGFMERFFVGTKDLENSNNGKNKKFANKSKPSKTNGKTYSIKNTSSTTPIGKAPATTSPYKKTRNGAVIIDENDIPEKKGDPSPQARPDNNYRTQRLPDAISKKSYTRENQHLPQAVYNEEYKKILFDSAAIGNSDILRAMVDNFGDTEILDNEGNTPLIYATMAGNLQTIITLTSMNANINAQNSSGVSSLYAATKLGRVDIAKFLLFHKANPDLGDKNDKTPLMLASEMDFSSIATLLVHYGADINKKMRNGNTAIHLAAQNNNLATLNFLITKADKIDIRNFKAQTPLMVAIETGQEKSIGLLLNAGADLTKTNAQGQDITAIAASTGNSSILELIETEKIRRNFLAQKLIETRRNQHIPVKDVVSSQESPNLPTSQEAKRVNGIPLPFKRPERLAKPAKEAVNNTKAPKPFFSAEEVQKMQNSGL